MIALFDKRSNHVGWLDEKNNNIFAKDLAWLGFVKNGYLFNTKCEWLGGMINGSIIDCLGKPIVWSLGSTPQGTLPLIKPLKPFKPLTPLKPLKPLDPLLPLKPLTPVGGWSNSEWYDLWK